MAVFAMEAASVISERSLEISFASALSTVSASGLNINAGKPNKYLKSAVLCNVCVLYYCNAFSLNVSMVSFSSLDSGVIVCCHRDCVSIFDRQKTLIM